MRWIEFPPIAEFEDRQGIVRAIYGTTIFGRFEFAQRMGEIGKMLDEAAETLTWESLYLSQTQFRNASNKALACWGIDPDWLTSVQIEQFLFARGQESGWLIELSGATTTTTQAKSSTLAEAIAIVSTHCQSLQEALDLANNVPADLLSDVLNIRAGMQNHDKPQKPQQKQKEQYLKDNFDELMARF